jgi:hypothetical protein
LCSYSIVKILKLKSLKNINDKHKSLDKTILYNSIFFPIADNFVPDSWICRTIWRTQILNSETFTTFRDLFSLCS